MDFTSISEIDLVRAAAFIDGEGYLTIRKNNAPNSSSRLRRYDPAVSVTQNDPRLPEWFQRRFGGSIYHRPATETRSDTWVWTLTGSGVAINFIEAIRPHLLLKETQAWLILEYRQQCPPQKGGPGKSRSPEFLALQEGFYLALRGVNAWGLP